MLFDNTLSIYLFFKDLSPVILESNCRQGKKRGEDGIIKTWISREQKELFRLNKYLSQLFKNYHLVKKKKRKIADTSFKKRWL